jgi:TP901 family phage tail tape measure protein
VVSVADEEITLDGDTSGLVRALSQGRNAFEEMTKAAGLNDQQMKKVGQSYERINAQIAAAALKNAAATQQSSAAAKQNSAAMLSQAEAAAKLAAEERRVFQAMGLIRNANGSISNTKTGRFADAETIALAKSYVRSLEEVVRAEENAAAAQRARAAAAGRANATQPSGTMRAVGSPELVAAHNTRDLEAFRKVQQAVIGQIPQMITLRSILSGIPPVTMATGFAKATDALMEMGNSARYALYSISAGATVAGVAIGGFGVLALNAAVAHERAFANVRRTTQTTTAGYEVLRKNLQGLAMEIPITYEEITKIATAAGQLGIQASGVTNFTKTVAMLAATTNLTSDAAATALARFKAFFSESKDPSLAVTERTFSNLASSILKVGVNSIATESGIVNVATQISSMGKLAGFTANQVIGLSGALSSVGVAPELARGITTRLFTIMGDAVSAGGVQLEKFAGLAGVSATEFKKAWGTENFAPLFTNFLQGLHGVDLAGGDANATLRDLGITAVRDRPVWLRLAGAANELGEAGGLVAQTMADAEAGWRNNSELALQYTKISNTTAARIQVMAQAFEQLFASMGAETGNFVGELAKNVTGLLRVFDEFAQSDIGKVLGSVVVQGALVVGAILLVVGALAGLAATTQAVGTGFREMTAHGVTGAARLAGAFRIVAAASGIIGLVATLATTIGMFVAMSSAAEKAAQPVQDLAGLISAMQADAEAGANGIKFFAGESDESAEASKRAAEQAEGMSGALDGVKPSADGAGDALAGTASQAKQASFVFADAANAFFKSQLMIDQGFQKLFDPGTNGNQLAKKFNISLPELDWDRMIEASVKGKDVGKVAMDEIKKALRAANPDWSGEELAGVTKYFADFAGQVEEQLGNTKGPIQNQINATQALADSTKHSVTEMIDDYSLLEDVQKKTVDDMAAGFTEFANSSTLIGLTQKMKEIFAQDTTDDLTMEMKAAQWEQAWSEAYGGAAFSLEEYLTVFRRAAGEQDTFVTGLQTLSARMSDLNLDTALIADLAKMGPAASELITALINGTDEQLTEYTNLFGATGYDSMITLATQTAIGAEVVKNVLAEKGIEGLRAFNTSLSSGTGVEDALKELQLDVNGKPITPALKEPDTYAFRNSVQSKLNSGVSLPVTPYVTKPTITWTGAASGSANIRAVATGGYISGPGTGTSDDVPAWLSNGEFVMTAKATRAIGAQNLYAMMRAAQGGRSAPRGRGYATGGMVGGGSSSGYGGTTVVELSVRDRALLAQLGNVQLLLDGKAVAEATNSANFVSTKRGAS